jgi:hypothetical protein
VQLNFTFGSGVGVNAEIGVECDYFYLDTDERRRFSQVSHEYLIEQLQIQRLNNVSDHKISFNHPVKELIWTSSTDYGDAYLSLNGLQRFEKQKKEYFQLRQPYDYHSSIPGYNIPITERTELLTKPYDTGIRQHNERDVHRNDYAYIVTLENSKITFGTPTTSFDKFKIGDMISIVISTYPINTRTDNPTAGGDGVTQTDITYSRSTFNTVTELDSTDPSSKTVTFEPVINNQSGNNLINNFAPNEARGDRLNVFILGRIQQKEARCSKLAKNINVYSFSLRPEDHQPSGTCNFSRIDNARLITSENLSSEDNIYAVNYNILRIMSGMGGMAFAN